jgi:hypothetical protein
MRATRASISPALGEELPVSGRLESVSGIPASISPVRRETLERPGSALGRPESVSDLALVLVRRAWVWLPGWASVRLVSGSSRPTEGDRLIVLVGADLCHQSGRVGTHFVPTRTGHGVQWYRKVRVSHQTSVNA